MSACEANFAVSRTSERVAFTCGGDGSCTGQCPPGFEIVGYSNREVSFRELSTVNFSLLFFRASEGKTAFPNEKCPDRDGRRSSELLCERVVRGRPRRGLQEESAVGRVYWSVI